MLKRTQLKNRTLPDYTRGEEIMNMVTHIVGGGFGILILLFCLMRPNAFSPAISGISCCIYGISMITVYAISSIYHGLTAPTAKKVTQVLDHCAIYLLIAGTYTPIITHSLMASNPGIGTGLLLAQWGLAALAITLNAIDLKKYKIFSMVCYVGLGWCIILFLPQLLQVVEPVGFYYLLAGGISYSLGAILFGIGTKIRWMHSVFHVLVVIGSLLQFISIYFYIL